MATTATRIVPDTRPKGQKARPKPLSKAHKAKLAAALATWRASLTEEDVRVGRCVGGSPWRVPGPGCRHYDTPAVRLRSSRQALCALSSRLRVG